MTDAVVTAGGRISGPLAEMTGQQIKCLIEFDGQRLIDHVLSALHDADDIGRVILVAPPEIRDQVSLRPDDCFLDDTGSGPGNILAGLKVVADQEQVLFSTSDLPFVTAEAVDQLLSHRDPQYGVQFPVMTREEVRARFPREANSYMPLRDGDMAGSSVMLLSPRHLLDREAEIAALFNARKDLLKLAQLVGFGIGLRFAVTKLLGWRVLSVDQIVARVARVAGFPVRALRGCDPVLTIDVDHERDWAEALAHLDWEAEQRAQAG